MRCSWDWSSVSKSTVLLTLGCVGVLSAAAIAAQNAAAPPEAPPVSEFASVESLMNQVDYHVERIGQSLDSARYSEATQSRVAKDASVLIVLFMALGLHDEESAVKAAAPRLVELSEELVTSATDQDKAKAVYQELTAAMNGGASGGRPLSWEKRAQLGLLMKQVTTIHSRLKRNTRGESSLASRKEEAGGQAALLAAIGQAALVDTHEVKEPDMLDEWYKYASEMRAAAGAVGKAIAQDDFAAVQASMERLTTNCDGCHEAFRLAPISVQIVQ
jgi:cytochrome c556